MAKLNTEEKQLLKELIQPVQQRLNIAWLFSTVASLLLVVQAWLLVSIVADWFDLALVNASVDASAISPADPALFWQYAALLVVLFLLRPLLNLCRELIGVRASMQVRSKLRQRLLAALAQLGMARQAFGSDGSLSSQVIEQTDALDAYISRFVVQKKVVASTPIILLIACAWQSMTAALILLLTAPLVPVLMIIIGKMTSKKSAEQFSALAQLSGRFLDWVRGMTTLKRLQANKQAEIDLYNASEDYRKRTMEVLKIAFLNGAVLELLSAIVIALVAIYFGIGLLESSQWQDNPNALFSALFVLLLVPEFYAPLRQLGMDYHAQAQAQGAVQSLLPLLQKSEQLQELHKGGNVSPEKEGNDLVSLDYQQACAIEFDNLAIKQIVASNLAENKQVESNQADNSYSNDNDNQGLTRIRLAATSFKVESGQRIGLVGESGSGKSSLMQALLGFSEYQGQIILSDTQQHIDHRQLVMDEFRHHVGYLAQQVALLPMSIADNLRLAKPDASDEELIKVLTDVDLYELIKQLPNGINTELGERGRGLSGGQQQRLGMAQLLLRDAKLWLLDEPTEHLDIDTAEQLHQLLEAVSRDKTVIWITHSVEQLPWLDNIIEIGK